MIRIHNASQRGRTAIDWLDSRHSFSFGDYFDPQNMGFRALRVINEDRVAPGAGFGTHPHRDMEILTYVLEGGLQHKDSLGSGSVLRPGEFQAMSAGTGIRHSEFNASAEETVHFYQVWLLPDRRGHTPAYDQRNFAGPDQQGRLRVVASPSGREGSLTIHQDAEVLLGTLAAGDELVQPIQAGRHAWLQVLRGSVHVNGQSATAGDGVAVSDEATVTVRAVQPSEVMWFDLA
jgi:redox-sensitive bicupin YhaK (pirin superfamily)